jgi:glycine/D-amino acid oxidase-like deaminating enzyme
VAFKSGSLKDASIVVIGAGAVGATVSYRLAQAGAQVTTLERFYPGSGITRVSFAWINGYEKVPKHYHRLNVLSIRDHQDLADELNGRWVRGTAGCTGSMPLRQTGSSRCIIRFGSSETGD